MIRLAVLLMLAPLAAAAQGVLAVTVTGVRNDHGQVLVAVCDQAHFTTPHCAYQGRAPARAGAVLVQVPGVPAGTYAVQAFQDENDNGTLDRNFLGMPKEGMGFSRDAKMRFGPPSFDDAAVAIPAGGGALRFALHYFD